MTHLQRHILPRNLRSALAVCQIPLTYGTRLSEQTAPLYTGHRSSQGESK
jgi:hypothetical protein